MSSDAIRVYRSVLEGKSPRFPHGFFNMLTEEGRQNAGEVLRYAIEEVLRLTPDESLPDKLTVRAFYPIKLTGLVAKLNFSQGEILNVAYPGRYVSRDEMRDKRLEALREFFSGAPTPPPYPAEVQLALEKHFGGSVGQALRILFPGEEQRYFDWLGRRPAGYWNDPERCLAKVREMVERYPNLAPEHFWNEKLSTLLAVFGGNVGLARYIATRTCEAKQVLRAAAPKLDLYRDWPKSIEVIRNFLKRGKVRLKFARGVML